MNKAQYPKSEARNPRTTRGRAALTFYLLSLALCFSLCPAVLAQVDEEPPADAVPPPIRTLSKDEKTSLEAQNSNIKKRTKISLELMDARMLKAEKYHSETNFKDSLNELAGFQAILDNALDFLIKNDSGKSDRSFINFEIYLRKQVPRLEAIRREMPVKYGYYVGRLMRFVREARAKAVEPLFEDSVLPANASKKP
jgi:hypothetical protein